MNPHFAKARMVETRIPMECLFFYIDFLQELVYAYRRRREFRRRGIKTSLITKRAVVIVRIVLQSLRLEGGE
jgi:hypothetical protein